MSEMFFVTLTPVAHVATVPGDNNKKIRGSGLPLKIFFSIDNFLATVGRCFASSPGREERLQAHSRN